MKHGIYAFYDMQSESFAGMGLLVFPTDAAAVRNFQGAVAQDGNVVSASPEDFSLIKLGLYDLMLNRIIPNVSDPVSNPVITGREIVISMREKRDVGDMPELLKGDPNGAARGFLNGVKKVFG